ncbi:hypothetical protein SprV_0501802500 [Sparganum proliferum]
MNIGLCAFLLIAHGLQQRDGEPPMPQEQSGVTAGSASVAPHHQTHNYHYYYSGQLQPHRMGYVRRSFHGTTLDDALCERLGIQPYLTPVRKAFEAILRLLDVHVCRNMMPPKQNVVVRDVEEPMSSDRKPKIDLLKTCINCIPRLLPYEMSRTELVELLARVSLNVDEEVRMMAQQAMVNLIIESPAYRQKTIQAFIQFIQKYVPDTSPHQLDCGLKTLYTLLVNWKIALQRDAAVTTSLSEKSALVEAEGFALVMLCQCRPLARRLAVHILRETRAVLRLINLTATANREAPTNAVLNTAIGKGQYVTPATSTANSATTIATPELCCIDILDSLAPVILEQVLPLLPNSERHDLMNIQNIDFRSIAERSNPVWFSGPLNPALLNQRSAMNPQPSGVSGLVTPLIASSRPTDPKLSGFVPTTWPGGSLQEQSRVLVTTDKSGVTGSGGVGGSAGGRPPGATATSAMEPGGDRKVNACRTAAPLNSYCQLLQSPFLIQPQRERTQLTDVWGTVISVALSITSPLSCHPSMLHTWSIVFQRIHQLFPLIDPVTLATENRTSSILQRTSKKPTTERDQLLPLWHNYVVLACCIAPSSTGVCVVDRSRQGYSDVPQLLPSCSPQLPRLRAVGSAESMPNPSNAAGASASSVALFESNTVGPATAAGLEEAHQRPASYAPINNKLFLSAKENARDLVKLILPLLRCEQVELRESIICGLSRIQPAAFRDVLEDLYPILKDTTERKQENVRRRRRRDLLRVSLIRLLAHMAKNAVFQHAESYITTNQGSLLPVLVNFIEWTRAYLESVSEPTSVVVTSVGTQSSLLVQYAAAPTSANTAAAALAAAAAASSNNPVDSGLSNVVAVGAANTPAASGPGSPGTPGAVVATSVTPAAHSAAPAATSTPATLAPQPSSAATSSNVASVNTAATTTTSSSSSSSSHAQALPDPALVAEGRLFFCIFIRDLIRHLTREKRQKFLPASLRRSLFLLFSRWSGFYEHIHNGSDTKWSQNNASEPSFGKFGLAYKQPHVVATAGSATVALPSTLVDHVSGDLVVAMASITSADQSSTDGGDQYANSLNAIDSSLWLELIWCANQAMGAVVCCGPIFDPCALFLSPPAVGTTAGAASSQQAHVRSMSCSVATSGEGTRAAGVGDELPLMAQSSSFSLTTVSASSAIATAAAAAAVTPLTSVVDSQGTASSGVATIPTASSAPTSTNPPVPARPHTRPSVPSASPPPGYLFHWLCGLLMSRDAKLLQSPWMWGCPVVSFGVVSTALKGGFSKSATANVHLEDSLRSVVISAAGGRRLDVLFRQLGEETLALLLDMNPDMPLLMDFFIDRCYTSNVNIVEAVFIILCRKLISNPNFACKKTELLVLAMVFSESAVSSIREHATYLLQILYQLYFLTPSRLCHSGLHQDTTANAVSGNSAEVFKQNLGASGCLPSPSDSESQTFPLEPCLSALADELLWRAIGHWRPSDVIRQFCAQHPTSTLPFLSEICKRLATATADMRYCLLRFLHYWAINVELVDLFARAAEPSVTHSTRYRTTSSHYSVRRSLLTADTSTPFIEPEAAVKASRGASSSNTQQQQQHQSPPEAVDVAGAAVVSTGPGGNDTSSSSSDSSVDDGGSEDSSNCDSDADMVGGQPTVAGARPTSLRSDLAYARRRVQPLPNNEAWASVPLTLRCSGWGSQQATEMILNNFLYLTIRFGNQPSECAALKELWILLIRYRPENLRYILHYLIVVVSLAPATLSSHANRIISYLAEEDVEEVIDILMVELQTIDGMGLVIEPVQSPPYFCLSTSLTTASADSNSMGTGRLAGDRETSSGSEVGNQLAAIDTSSNVPPDPEVQARSLGTTGAEDIPIQQTLAGQRHSLYVEPRSPSTSRQRPHSVCNLQATDQTAAQPNSDTNAAAAAPVIMDSALNNASTVSSGNAISRFATRASAVGRRAIRSALNRQDEKESHASPSRSRHVKPTAASDTIELEVDVDNFGSSAVESSARADGTGVAPSQAIVAARCNTLPNTETSRERYNKQAAGLSDKARPSRIKKILSKRARRMAKEYDRNNPTMPHRSSRLRAIFKGSGSGGGGEGQASGTDGGVAGGRGILIGVSSTLEAPLSVRPLDEALSARLQTASLPPNLASLQPLLLPLHSNSRSGFVDFRQRTAARFGIGSSGGGFGGACPSMLDGCWRDQPLPMPETGAYHAPIQEWLTEPFVTNGTTVLTGMWSPTGARSPLVLLLVGEIAKSPHRHRIAWRSHLPILLLCVFLGLDHCRPLIQEASKKLLINLLRVTCPRIEALRLLSLQLEVEQACEPLNPPAHSNPFLQDIFSTLSPLDEPFSNVSSCPAWKAYTNTVTSKLANAEAPLPEHLLFSHSSSGSPPGLSPSDPHLSKPSIDALHTTGGNAAGSSSNGRVAITQRHPLGLFGSTYSLMSTATLIPGTVDAELKRRSVVAMTDQHVQQLSQQQQPPPPPPLNHPLDLEISVPHVLTSIPTVMEGAEATIGGEQAGISPPANASRGLDSLGECGGESRFIRTNTSDRTPIPLINDCELKHMHAAAEDIKKLLDEIQDRSVWTWEDVSPARFQQATLLSLTHAPDLLSLVVRPSAESATPSDITSQNAPSSPKRENLILLRSASFLHRLVCCVVAVIAEAEAGCQEAPVCLQCHHGAQHKHSKQLVETPVATAASAGVTTTTPAVDEVCEDSSTDPASCTVTRFAQAAFDMGLTCPNKHYASRSLQMYRSLEAQLDEVRLSKVLALLTELIADNSDDVQGYVVELFLTLEAALDHLQRRGTVLPVSPFPASLTTRSPLESPHACSSAGLVHSGPLPAGNNTDPSDDVTISRKPPPPPPPTGVSTPAAATVVVHERRHSRRGSSSSLSSLLNTAVAAPAASVGGPTAPRGHGSNTSLGSLCGAPVESPTTKGLTAPQQEQTSYVAPATPGRRVLTPHEEEEVAEVETSRAGEPISAKRCPKKPLTGAGINNPKKKPEAGTCRLSQDEQAELVSRIFWIGVCLLDSDYEYEYLAGLRLLNRLLPAVCMNPATYLANGGGAGRRWNNPGFVVHPSLHERVQKTLHRFKWAPEFPGLLSLLIKGCSSQQLIDPSYRLLIRTIPALKSPVVDPFSAAAGDSSRQYRRLHHHYHQNQASARATVSSQSYPGSLPTLVITLLPLLLTAWDEDPENPANAQDFSVCHAAATAAAAAGGGGPQTTWASNNTAAGGAPKSSVHALELTDIATTYGLEGNGSTLPPGGSMGPPLGSWAYRCSANANAVGGGSVDVSGAACGAFPPSSGYLALVTATVAGGSAAKKAPAVRPRNPICILAAEQLADLAIQTDPVRFNNLAIVLRLYAAGTFSKDVNQWAKCVTRYLIDGCPALGPKLLSYLTALLTHGPACVHLPLLHFAYWFLQNVELNQTEMNIRIRAFITSTSEKFVNTPLWPEVTLVLQAIVARSATLTSAPAPSSMYTLPGLDPAGSGRVLDLAAAAAAVAVPLPESEPQRIALAGRVLDFDASVIQNVPIVGAQFIGQAGAGTPSSPSRSSCGGLRPATNAGPEDTTTTAVETLSGKSFFRVGCWKTPWTCQGRIRSRLCCLLSCYGTELDHLASQRSPSTSSRQKVIFSQSTETLDHQLSMPSSSETASINDASNIVVEPTTALRTDSHDGRLDDTSSVERAAVFHDLDTYLDAQLMNINFLDMPDGTWEDETRRPWGVRGHSITSHTDFHEDGNETAGMLVVNESTGSSDPRNRKNLTLELSSKGTLEHPLGSWSPPLDSSPTQPNPSVISANSAGGGGGGIADEDLSATTSADLAPARRNSISVHSNSSSVSVGTRGISLLAPVLNRQFTSELMVAWVSQDSSPTDWLGPSVPSSRQPAKLKSSKKTSAGAASQSPSHSRSASRKRTLSAQPTPTAVSSTTLSQRVHFSTTLDTDFLPDDLDYYEPVFKRVSAATANQKDNRCKPVAAKVFQRSKHRPSIDQALESGRTSSVESLEGQPRLSASREGGDSGGGSSVIINQSGASERSSAQSLLLSSGGSSLASCSDAVVPVQIEPVVLESSHLAVRTVTVPPTVVDQWDWDRTPTTATTSLSGPLVARPSRLFPSPSRGERSGTSTWRPAKPPRRSRQAPNLNIDATAESKMLTSPYSSQQHYDGEDGLHSSRPRLAKSETSSSRKALGTSKSSDCLYYTHDRHIAHGDLADESAHSLLLASSSTEQKWASELQTAISERIPPSGMTVPQRRRLALLLTDFRAIFAGAKRRSTVRAVRHATLAFQNSAPGSDLDPEIKLSNLAKIADAINVFLPLPFFAIHPNSAQLLDKSLNASVANLAEEYHCWQSQMAKLSSICAQSKEASSDKLECICQHLSEVLRCLLRIFEQAVHLLHSARDQLTARNTAADVRDLSSLAEDLFGRLRPHISAVFPESAGCGGQGEAVMPENWRHRIYESLQTRDDTGVRRALAIFCQATAPCSSISADHIAAIMEIYFSQFWTEPSISSGVALCFLQAANSQAASASTALPSSFFSFDTFLNSKGEPLPPAKLVTRFQRLLFEITS